MTLVNNFLLDRCAGTLHAQLLSSVVSPSTFQIDSTTALGTQLATMGANYKAVVTIENEQILLSAFSNVAGTVTATIDTRGYNGTTAATHAAGVAVEMHFTKAHLDNLNTSLNAHETFINGGATGNGGYSGLIPQSTVTTIASATSHTIAGDQTLIFTVGRIYLFKVVSTWYKGTITAVSFGAGTTTITLSGISLAAAGTVVACGFEFSPSINAPIDQVLQKQLGTDPTVNPPSTHWWLYFKSGGLYTMKSDGTVSQVLTSTNDPTGVLIAGENLTAGQALYVKASDGKAWRAASNADESTYSFIGICAGSVSTGANVTFWKVGAIASGVAAGTIGQTAYITDTAGTIGATPGTNYAAIGIYITTTSILIKSPKFIRRGSASMTSVTTFVQTCGFYPAKVQLMAVDAAGNALSNGDDSNICHSWASSGTTTHAFSLDASHAWNVWNIAGSGVGNRGTVSAKSQTGFTLNCDTHGEDATIYWIAEN